MMSGFATSGAFLGIAYCTALHHYYRAHAGERGAAVAGLETQDATLAARIEVAAHTVADLDRASWTDRQRDRGSGEAWQDQHSLSAMEGQRKARAAPAGEWQREAEALAGIK